jgi:enterobactin synthetase component D
VHSASSIAAVAPTRGLGIDIERWLDEGAPGRLAADLTVEGELAMLTQAIGWPASRVLTLIFSAKETLFKCLFPQVNTYFGFQHVRIVAIAPKAGEFKATLETSLGPLPTGYSFVGRYQCLDEVLVTSLTLSLDP